MISSYIRDGCSPFLVAIAVVYSMQQRNEKGRSNFRRSQSDNYHHDSEVLGSIESHLDTTTAGRFLIADPAVAWAAGCLREEGMPDKQSASAAMGTNTFWMTYWQGGIGSSKRIMTLLLREEKVGDEFYESLQP